jgi:hypothetical protein
VYVNAQQFNKDFAKDWFGTKKGARWKVPGSPRGQAGLEYLGDDPEAYRALYQIKSKDDAESWEELVRLTRILNETPPDQLEQTLAPILDVDGALKFLALDIALINNDGYWVRASDYSLYQDPTGQFHVIPNDMNETFTSPGGPGFGGPPGFGRRGFRGPPEAGGFGPGPRIDEQGLPSQPAQAAPQADSERRGRGGAMGAALEGVKLNPLHIADDPTRPLASKLLAVPELRRRYLTYVRDIAERWLDWNKLGPVAMRYHELIADTVKKDTHKLESTEAFLSSLTSETSGGFGPGRKMSLKSFADQRRAYLLEFTGKASTPTD